MSSLRGSIVLGPQQTTQIGRIFLIFGVASFLLCKRFVFKHSSFVALLMLAAAGASACSSVTSSSPTTPSSVGGSTSLTAAQVSGTWTLTSVQPAASAEQAAPASAIYSLTLDGERIASQVDCNRCAGAMKLDGNRLTLGPALACTKAACRTMAFESTYLSGTWVETARPSPTPTH